MFKEKPILKYESVFEAYPNAVSTAKSHIPEWYKKIPKFKNKGELNEQKGLELTLKGCMPFIDAISCGYMITLPYDIYVKDNNGYPLLFWRDLPDFQTPRQRDQVADKSLVPTGHYELEYTWNTCVSIEAPKGYSMLLTHPLNRYDLPFTTLSGIIEGGLSTDPHGNYPFYIKKGFEGFIEQGTPIIQIIPFKQDAWKSEKTDGVLKKSHFQGQELSLKFFGWYKNTIWNRKDYS